MGQRRALERGNWSAATCLPGPARAAARVVLTLWRSKVDHVAIALEHVDLLNGLNRLDVQLLQGLLQLLVVAAGAGRRPLNLSPGSTLATISIGTHG